MNNSWIIALLFTGSTVTLSAQAPVDSILPDDPNKTDAAIEEVIRSRSLPQKEKVQYFSQVTRYGFKNLFSNLTYNSALPYTAQINPNAELFIQGYMRTHSKYLNQMKSWGQPYFNLIEQVLIQYGLPRELKYIAVIESNLKSGATSYKGAGGPWQFMPYTAREYGLTVNAYIDERRDYLRSTHAASRYLLTLYRQLHDWLLVMAAYNGGPGRVESAIRKSKSRNFWDLQYYLPEESRTYVKRFIATHYIMEGAGGITTNTGTSTGSFLTPDNGVQITRYGNPAPNQHNRPTDSLAWAEVERLPVSGKYNSVIMAKNLFMNLTEFNHYNPGFDAALMQDGNYELRLPPDKMQLFQANRYQILNECVQVLLSGARMPVNKTTYPPSGVKAPQRRNR